MTTLQPGVIYHAVQDRRQYKHMNGWEIFDKFGRVAYISTLVALRKKAKGHLVAIGKHGKKSSNTHYGVHPKYKGIILDRYTEAPDHKQACEDVSIHWFVVVEKEISLEGIC